MTDNNDTTVRFRFATRNDIRDIVALDRRYLPADTIIAESVFESWRAQNPRTFMALLVDDAVRGYFSVLPLRAKTMARFISGALAERDFGADDILAESDAPDAGAGLYLYSIVVAPEARPLLAEVLRQLAGELRHYAGRQPVERVCATAATAAGRRLLERLGFERVMAGARRADGHDLYMLTGDALDNLMQHEAVTA